MLPLVLPIALSLSAFANDSGEDTAGIEPPLRAEDSPTLTYWEATGWLTVRRAPRGNAEARGVVIRGYPFEVLELVPGEDKACRDSDWGRLPAGGYVCLKQARPVTDGRTPETLPRLVTFDHPAPSEYRSYVRTGTYDRSPLDESEALVPFIYGKVWRRWTAPTWKSLQSWNRGGPPDGNLDIGTKLHFVEAIETKRGTVLRRDDGRVVPADQVFLYPVTRFHGRDLEVQPLAAGRLQGWVVPYDGAPLRAAPDRNAEVVATLEYHTPLEVLAEPADEKGRWHAIPDALGPGVPGYIDERHVGTYRPVSRPPGVGDQETWVDVDVEEQALALMEGDNPIFVTLVSTGEAAEDFPTPTGLYTIYDKSAWGDMNSREDAEEPYAVENVPWIMHFWPRYALHGVFWHWGMGHQASHGCINLAPRDAAYIFERVGPELPEGWHTTYISPEDPGTTLRVRWADNLDLRDRRKTP